MDIKQFRDDLAEAIDMARNGKGDYLGALESLLDELDEEPRSKRQAAYTNEGFVKDGDWFVAIVTEDEAGYNETNYTGTLDYCKAVAQSINDAKGFTKRDVDDIVTSSFRAQQVMEDFLAGEGPTS